MEQRDSQILMLKIQLPLQYLPPILIFQRNLMHTFVRKGHNITKQPHCGLFPYKDVAIKKLRYFTVACQKVHITHPKCSI